MTKDETIEWQNEYIEHLEVEIELLKEAYAEELANNLILRQQIEQIIKSQQLFFKQKGALL